MLTAHERSVDRLYGHVDGAAPDSHAGYLNFGLWDDGIGDYVAAAENLVTRLGTLLELTPGARVVDAACGRGTQDFCLLSRFGDIEIEAVDVTRHHVEVAGRRARSWPGPGRVGFHHGSATRLPFADGSFSHAMCLEAAHHFDTREEFLREAFRVLRPGGRVALAEVVLARTPKTGWQRALVGSACALWRIPRANLDDRDTYRAKLERIGFTDIAIESVADRTFPGYYREQTSPARRRELRKLRGRAGEVFGLLMNTAAYRVYRAGFADYLLVAARKPG